MNTRIAVIVFGQHPGELDASSSFLIVENANSCLPGKSLAQFIIESDGDVFKYTELFMNPDHYQLDLIKKR